MGELGNLYCHAIKYLVGGGREKTITSINKQKYWTVKALQSHFIRSFLGGLSTNRPAIRFHLFS